MSPRGAPKKYALDFGQLMTNEIHFVLDSSIEFPDHIKEDPAGMIPEIQIGNGAGFEEFRKFMQGINRVVVRGNDKIFADEKSLFLAPAWCANAEALENAK
jgi:hypothetical protein